MADDRPTPLIDPRDPLRAVMLLTRLPVRGADGARGAQAAWAWPLVGLLLGGLAGLVATCALAIGLPSTVAAGLALTTMVVATGGLHEDGLADCADGFWGAHDREARLAIMKDSRIGAYGVLALVLGLGLQWSALAALIEDGRLWPAVLASAALSRAAIAGLMAGLPLAREDGVARHVGRPPAATAALSAALAALAAMVVAGFPAGAAATLSAAAVAIFMSWLAMSRIGGQTGDVLGAAQQLCATATLLAMAAMTPV